MVSKDSIKEDIRKRKRKKTFRLRLRNTEPHKWLGNARFEKFLSIGSTKNCKSFSDVKPLKKIASQLYRLLERLRDS
jgi:hypothetical protein